jgi:hypothetical protein
VQVDARASARPAHTAAMADVAEAAPRVGRERNRHKRSAPGSRDVDDGGDVVIPARFPACAAREPNQRCDSVVASRATGRQDRDTEGLLDYLSDVPALASLAQ